MENQRKMRVFRDPLYGYIHVEETIIKQLIDTSAFQRLRRIKQLSGVQMVFHGAEHSRFNHSLGVYEIANKFLNIPDIKDKLSKREKLLFLVSALLHDIGHGPYSHAFEDAFGVDHEKIGARLIVENVEIKTILQQVDQNFALDVASIILKEHRFVLIEQLISSQLDCDRLDYLGRDAYYTGVTYGTIDLDRLMRVLRIRDNQVVFKKSGIHAIENYLISRYHMYWQVYYHKTSRAYEVVLEKIYKRVKDLMVQKYQFVYPIDTLKSILDDTNDLNTFLDIDDYYINGLIKGFSKESDDILKSLSGDFLNRKIWKIIPVNENTITLIEDIKKEYNEEEKAYYYDVKTVFESTYLDNEKNMGEKIYILNEDGQIKSLIEESKIIYSLLESGQKSEPLFFYRQK